MNTPEQEAEELIDKMYNEFPESYNKEQMAIDALVAKCQAIIAVDKILSLNKRTWTGSKSNGGFINSIDINHYQKVRAAIEAKT